MSGAVLFDDPPEDDFDPPEDVSDSFDDGVVEELDPYIVTLPEKPLDEGQMVELLESDENYELVIDGEAARRARILGGIE